MTPDQITQLRHVLKVAVCPNCDGSGAIAHQVSEDEWEPEQCLWCVEREQALVLLPCETCNGTRKVPYVPIGGMFPHPSTPGPCPDCRKKLKQEESPPSTMWGHLH